MRFAHLVLWGRAPQKRLLVPRLPVGPEAGVVEPQSGWAIVSGQPITRAQPRKRFDM
jgi:hypothetical protein